MSHEPVVLEISNPSDACTLKAANVELACLACVFLGPGYGLSDAGGESVMPIWLFGGVEQINAWWRERFGRSFEDAFTHYKLEAPELLAEALGSVIYGGFGDRDFIDKVMGAAESPDSAARLLADWQDRKRSSMNNIAGKGLELARLVREAATAPRTAKAC